MALNTLPGDPDQDSYASLDDAAAYATARGLTFPVSGDDQAPAEQALRRAAAAVDGLYGPRFPGCPTSQDQALEWPRTGVRFRGQELPDDEIPRQIVNATIEAAVREKAEPGSMNPDQERSIKTLKAGSVEIDYDTAAPVETRFSVIDGILAPLIGSGTGQTKTGLVERV